MSTLLISLIQKQLGNPVHIEHLNFFSQITFPTHSHVEPHCKESRVNRASIYLRLQMQERTQ